MAGTGNRPRPVVGLIAAVYIGFAVADGRPRVIAVESSIAGAFLLLAGTAITASAWLLVLGYTGHGLKDAWQERNPLCRQHPIVAAVLRHRRLARRRHPHHRDRRRSQLPLAKPHTRHILAVAGVGW